jgi:hypothetical protein
MARYYQVASALYEVLRDVTKNKVDPQVMHCNCLFLPSSSVNFFNPIFHF